MEVFWNPFVLLAVGLVMIFLEFFLPGGILGIAGGVVLILSVVAFGFAEYPPLAFALYLIFVIVILILLIRFALWRIKRTGKDNTIMLERNQTGYVASTYDKEMVGMEGLAMTDLKPSGKINIAGKELQAVSALGYIQKGSRIKVVKGEGAHLVVQQVR